MFTHECNCNFVKIISVVSLGFIILVISEVTFGKSIIVPFDADYRTVVFVINNTSEIIVVGSRI